MRNSSQSSLKLIINEVPSHQHIAKCQYSTVLNSHKSLYRSCYLYTAAKCISPVSLMSTNIDNSQYHIVVTNPSQSSTNSGNLSNSEQFSDISNSVIGSSSSTITTEVSNASTDLSDIAVTISNNLQNAPLFVEPPLSSLDLAHWTPPGLVQMLLEYLHVSWSMPWWGAIVASTLVARILLLPVLIKTQRNTITFSNYMPGLQYLQAKFGEARKAGNSMEASRYAVEISEYMKKHNLSPFKTALLPLMQAPVFLSFFLGLRAMAKAPVESMQWGGLGWTIDLTVPDPYYILPILSCSTLYVVLKIGAESGVKLENMKLSRYVLQALPIVALPFCIHFPSAVLYYWVTTNFCTLAIVSVLKIKPIRKFLNLPTQKPVDSKYVLPKKGFVGGIKEAIEDQKVLGAISDRRRMDEMRFQKAGTGPVPRTYSYDPTKARPANAAATASQHSVSAQERKT
ncbi:mitochondrial inner membrane protein OXA1L [Trichonephila inaurata madagascariensis]|uniref:Mitochondrial inner membrane protein OXA1L n=1 Tax=Trichonephila inaurata madagascariensis TaxID=2747483 RepID=A0A8X6Y0U3_9ARAC|nr:mitochondrial inner membrane protein OXA1L [Trichonephila inaurata madagascariensis]